MVLNYSSSLYNVTIDQNVTVDPEQSGNYDNYIKIPATLCVSIALVILLFLIATIGFISKLRNGRPQRQMMKFIFLSETVSVFTTLIIFLFLYFGNDVINETGCFVVAILEHYLVLVTVMWGCMNVLGCYFVYVKLVGLDFLGYRWKMLASCLVIPLIPVVIPISITTNSYSSYNSQRCWYHDAVGYYGLFLPVTIVTIIAIIIFTVILVHTIRSSSQTTQGQRTRQRIIRRVCKVFGSMVLFVSSMIFAHFVQSSHHAVLSYYLFCITSLGYSSLMFKRSLDKLSRAYWKTVFYRNSQGDPV